MASPCRVMFIANPDQLSVHIYDRRTLLFADDDEPCDIERLAHGVRRFLRARDITGFDLRFTHDVSYSFRRELAYWIQWLLRGGKPPEDETP